MRYRVKYDDMVEAWAVVDTRTAGLAVCYCEEEENAKDRAWHEEERWYKNFPESPRPMWM